MNDHKPSECTKVTSIEKRKGILTTKLFQLHRSLSQISRMQKHRHLSTDENAPCASLQSSNDVEIHVPPTTLTTHTGVSTPQLLGSSGTNFQLPNSSNFSKNANPNYIIPVSH